MKTGESNPSLECVRTSTRKGRSIAVTGKGGAGKTMLAALMIKLLTRSGKARILAIDADSSVSLPYALGMAAGKTVSDIRREIIEFPEVKRRIADQHISVVMKSALVSANGLDLLVMGRPEEPGCFCAVNDLLKYGIDVLALDYDFTIIDGEAGPEQLNRRVLRSIDTLLVVADTSARSLQTARTIMKVALSHGKIDVEKPYLVLNRCRGKRSPAKKIAQEMGLEIAGIIPEDENVSQYDSVGRPLLEIPEDSPSIISVRRIMKRINKPTPLPQGRQVRS